MSRIGRPTVAKLRGLEPEFKDEERSNTKSSLLTSRSKSSQIQQASADPATDTNVDTFHSEQSKPLQRVWKTTRNTVGKVADGANQFLTGAGNTSRTVLDATGVNLPAGVLVRVSKGEGFDHALNAEVKDVQRAAATVGRFGEGVGERLFDTVDGVGAAAKTTLDASGVNLPADTVVRLAKGQSLHSALAAEVGDIGRAWLDAKQGANRAAIGSGKLLGDLFNTSPTGLLMNAVKNTANGSQGNPFVKALETAHGSAVNITDRMTGIPTALESGDSKDWGRAAVDTAFTVFGVRSALRAKPNPTSAIVRRRPRRLTPANKRLPSARSPDLDGVTKTIDVTDPINPRIVEHNRTPNAGQTKARKGSSVTQGALAAQKTRGDVSTDSSIASEHRRSQGISESDKTSLPEDLSVLRHPSKENVKGDRPLILGDKPDLVTLDKNIVELARTLVRTKVAMKSLDGPAIRGLWAYKLRETTSEMVKGAEATFQARLTKLQQTFHALRRGAAAGDIAAMETLERFDQAQRALDLQRRRNSKTLTRELESDAPVDSIHRSSSNYDDAWAKVDTWLKEDPRGRMDPRLVRNRLAELSNELTKDAPLWTGEMGTGGQLRGDGFDIGAGSSNFIPGSEVEAAVRSFSEWFVRADLEVLTGNMTAIELAARSYQSLVSIHPFMDGNGRTARMFMDWVLKRHGLEPCTFISKQEKNSAYFVENYTSDVQINRANEQKSPDEVVADVVNGVHRTVDVLEAALEDE